MGSAPQSLVANPASTRIYVMNTGDNTVSVIDVANNNVIATIELSSSVSVIDTSTSTVVTTISVGVKPAIPTLNAADTFLYVTDLASGVISIIDTTVGQKINDNTLSKSK